VFVFDKSSIKTGALDEMGRERKEGKEKGRKRCVEILAVRGGY
jgi:hypothetical protein